MPVPYVNLASSMDLTLGSTTTQIDGMPVALQGSMFAKSTGDEPGAIGGVTTATVALDAKFFTFSPTVSIEGKPVARFTDKMLMNHGNTVCLAGEMQAPLPPSSPGMATTKPETPQACKFQQLTVKCGHGERNYELDAERNPGALLQVITSHEAETLSVTYQGACSLHPSSSGACGAVHAIGLNDEEELPVTPGRTIELPLRGEYDSFVRDWWNWLRRTFTGQDMPTEMFTVWGTTCNGRAGDIYHSGEFVMVEVFPNASWKGTLELGYKHEKQKGDPKNPGAALKALEEQAQWELKGSVEAVCGYSVFKQEWGVSGSGARADSDPASRALFRAAREFIDGLAKVLRSLADFYATDLDIRWPCLKMSGEVELVEVPGKPLLERAGKLTIEFDKLLGVEIKLDILEWLLVAIGTLSAGPAGTRFAKYLVDVKKKAEEGTYQHRVRPGPTERPARSYDGMKIQEDKIPLGGSLKFGIDLTIGGDIFGTLGCKVSPSAGISLDADKNSIGAGIDAQLEAFCRIEGKVWIIGGGAGFSMTAQGADGKSPSRVTGELKLKASSKKVGKNMRHDLIVGGQLTFNGLAIFYAYFAELNLGASSAGGDEGENADAFGGKKATIAPKSKSEVKENKRLCTLIAPCKFPDTAAASSALDGL
jgi:uncharacterized Zn-binding protein involved in type VI secretion